MADLRNKKDVASIKHKEKRSNIPTEELRDFYSDDLEKASAALYPRDPSLDPQLVWKGKDEADTEDFSVPIVPIYIQEKIHPQALVDDLQARPEVESDGPLFLFSDFNGGPKDFESKIDFYHHEQNWTNRLILGDSLLVLNSLSQKEGLAGKTQMVYLDPPYGIKFGSNWQVSTRKTKVDESSAGASRQPEQVRAFRDTWKLGVHSYLSYLRDRLVVSRDLLNDTGSVFVQIGEENVHLVRSVMDEVFGSENFVRVIVYQKTTGAGSPGELKTLPSVCDYIIWYAKNKESMKYRQLYREKAFGTEGASGYTNIELLDGSRRSMTKEEREDVTLIPSGARIFAYDNTRSQSGVDKTRYPVTVDGKTYRPDPGTWKTHEEGMKRLINAGRIAAGASNLSYIRYLDDFPAVALNNVWTDSVSGFMADKVYVVQSTTKVVQRCMLMVTDPGDLVIDPTCGSGTTAVVAEQWGRRWITCDTSRVALALTRTRMMSSKFPKYFLSDSQEGARKEMELSGTYVETKTYSEDIRKGFVYKRVPHITLKSIANNVDITEALSLTEARRIIERGSEQELLYDVPIEDKKGIRVCGPFSVESLSPHRVLELADVDLSGKVSESEIKGQSDFSTMIIDNLKKAGVQNTAKDERLIFTSLEPHPGTWINAHGTYEDAGGVTRRVAVSIGPEHGTVGPTQIKQSAKEAVQGVGFDVLIVCGFAFDPHVSEETKRYGNLTVLATKMNPDLAMGEELLKQTGTGNLFMVFGDPDFEVHMVGETQIQVELLGLDVYDPTTGQVRSSSTDEIACWFIDTDYNEESFFVRHAYFVGADKPMEKLRKALKASIDEDAWMSIYGTTSRPFDKPKNETIAVKVINHYGDEVLKVYKLEK